MKHFISHLPASAFLPPTQFWFITPQSSRALVLTWGPIMQVARYNYAGTLLLLQGSPINPKHTELTRAIALPSPAPLPLQILLPPVSPAWLCFQSGGRPGGATVQATRSALGLSESPNAAAPCTCGTVLPRPAGQQHPAEEQ